MKKPHIFIIAALTADGFIGRDEHHTATWTSKEDKRFFVERTKQAGVVVMGSRTYSTLGHPLKERLNIVYSHTSKDIPGVEVTSKPPGVLVNELSGRGFSEIAIIGGSQVYGMFLSENLVDTMYFTIEPILFGKGLSPFSVSLEKRLSLVSVERLGEQAVLLEYQVKKSL